MQFLLGAVLISITAGSGVTVVSSTVSSTGGAAPVNTSARRPQANAAFSMQERAERKSPTLSKAGSSMAAQWMGSACETTASVCR